MYILKLHLLFLFSLDSRRKKSEKIKRTKNMATRAMWEHKTESVYYAEVAVQQGTMTELAYVSPRHHLGHKPTKLCQRNSDFECTSRQCLEKLYISSYYVRVFIPQTEHYRVLVRSRHLIVWKHFVQSTNIYTASLRIFTWIVICITRRPLKTLGMQHFTCR